MEKAILRTLVYYDIFDFPLKVWEVQKWLTDKEASLKQVEKKLIKMKSEGKVGSCGDYWFLIGRKSLVKDRLNREEVSVGHLRTANFVATVFKLVPWIKLVGISGSLAMLASRKTDDIDLFIVTEKNRIWITRLLLICLTSLVGLRRKRREKMLSAAGKLCINLILETDNLAQTKRNIYVSHEVLQMLVLWQRDDIYSEFLQSNSWAFKFLPNWKSGIRIHNSKFAVQNYNAKVKNFKIVDWFEERAKRFQLRVMDKPTGEEKIENGALYFHPEDKGKKILEEYKERLSSRT